MAWWNSTAGSDLMVGVSGYRTIGSSDRHPCMGALPAGGAADSGLSGGVMLAEPKTKTQRPPMYKVFLLNDDYTPMDFVVSVLEQIFRKSHADARQLMLEVHEKGVAMVGVFTRDVAETKVDQVVDYARINEYPLQCTLEADA